MPIVVSLLFGFIPMFLFGFLVYWVDRYEKEPKFLLGFVFLWGAVVAAGVAYLLNSLFGASVFLITQSELTADFSTGAISAPIIEESMKGFAVLIVFFLAYNEFDSIIDGIVYAAVTALGFAATENSFYIYNYGYLESGWSGLFDLAFIRIVLVGWQHPFYTAFIGIGLAISRTNKSTLIKWITPILGWIAAVTLHSIHNIIASLANGPIGLFLGTSLDWIGWFFMLVFILVILIRENKQIKTILLLEEINSPVHKSYFDSVTNPSQRLQYRIKHIGSKKLHEYNRFLQLSAELAHKIHQEERIEKKSRYQKNIHELRNDIQTCLLNLEN
ncbi:MAG: PrsW family intramembrane metalloprotease [Anaerolineaceae bacterium]|nr:PrsW family intramembrane metalloprotease [Anaerolineaceae bacterium]